MSKDSEARKDLNRSNAEEDGKAGLDYVIMNEDGKILSTGGTGSRIKNWAIELTGPLDTPDHNDVAIAQKRAVAVMLHKHAEYLYQLSYNERVSVCDDLKISAIISADYATTQCAGYAISLRKNTRRNSAEAILGAKQILVLGNPEIVEWLQAQGKDNPAMSAWIYTVEVLKQNILEYHMMILESESAKK